MGSAVSITKELSESNHRSTGMLHQEEIKYCFELPGTATSVSMSFDLKEVVVKISTGGSPLFNKFKKMKEDLLATINTGKDEKLFIKQFRNVWIALTDKTVEEELNLRLMPYFMSDNDLKVLSDILTNLYILLCGSTLSHGGSSLITGPAGMGKSTFIESIHVIVTLFLSDTEAKYSQCISLFVTYDMIRLFQLPSQMIAEVARTIYNCNFNDEISSDNAGKLVKNGKNYIGLFFVDDIHTLYVKKDHPYYDRNIGIIRELSNIGKNINHMGICTGRTSAITASYYSQNTSEFEEYHSLMTSSYVIRPIIPHRNRLEFVEYCKFKNKEFEDPNDDRFFMLYALSGGTRRLLGSHLYYSAEDLKSTIKFTNELYNIRDIFMETMLLEIVKNTLSHLSTGSFNGLEHSHSLSKARVSSIFDKVGSSRETVSFTKIFTTVDEALAYYQDVSLLYVDEFKVEFLLPIVLMNAFQRYFNGSYEEMLKKFPEKIITYG